MSKERRTVSIDPDVHEYLGRTGVNASELVEELVQQHMKTNDKHTVALQVQINQKERELSSAEERVSELRQDLKELRSLRDRFESEQEDELAVALESLDGTPADPTNEAIINRANELGITPEELADELKASREP